MIDSVVRIEQATGEPANILVTQNPDGTTSIETSASEQLIVKDEKNVAKIESSQFAIPTDIKDIKGLDLKVTFNPTIRTGLVYLKLFRLIQSFYYI